MTQLTKEMYKIFDQPEFSFKKIKENKTSQEVDKLKTQFKEVWQVWKQVNQSVAKQLPEGLVAKVHVESWTNGWNLRDHYWASYRLAKFADCNPCIGVMIDKKQFQVYLMFQHYKSEKRQGSVEKYNQLLKDIPTWSENLNLDNWYIWDKDDMEFNDHLLLSNYLKNNTLRKSFNEKANQTSFLVGKFAFRDVDKIDNMEEFILAGIKEILPLYEKIGE